MTLRARVLLGLLTLLATMFLVNCGGSYNCQVTFGSSSCTPSGSGLGSGGGSGGGGGGGGSSAAAFVFAVDENGTLDGYTLSTSAGTFQATANYTPPAIPIDDAGAGMVIAQQQFVYAIFHSTGQIFGWSVSSSGSLTALTNLPASLIVNPLSIPFNQYNMATNPAGTLLFVSDALDNVIHVFQISTAGALTEVTGSPFTTPAETGNPGNLTTDGLGKVSLCQRKFD